MSKIKIWQYTPDRVALQLNAGDVPLPRGPFVEYVTQEKSQAKPHVTHANYRNARNVALPKLKGNCDHQPNVEYATCGGGRYAVKAKTVVSRPRNKSSVVLDGKECRKRHERRNVNKHEQYHKRKGFACMLVSGIRTNAPDNE